MNRVLLLLIVLSFVGCRGTLDLGIEQTPTPNRAAGATITALANENARLATLVATRAGTPAPQSLGRLAFVQGSDIWVKTLPDDRPQRITTDGRNREPRWSPSGNWLAYRKDYQGAVKQEIECQEPGPRSKTCYDMVLTLQKQVWLVQADGTGATVLNNGLSVERLAWSPKEDRVALVTAAGELHGVDPAGLATRALVPATISDRGAGQVGRIAWSPDGRWIAYQWRIRTIDQGLVYQGLWKTSADGQDRVELYDSGAPNMGEAVLAGWTPDGKGVLFWQGQAAGGSLVDGALLYRISADKSRPEGSSPTLQKRDPVLAFADFVAAAPTAQDAEPQSAIAVVVGSGRNTWANKRIELAGPISQSGLAAISPTWSPTGERLAYTAMPDRDDLELGESALRGLMQRRIWVADVAGEVQTWQLTNSVSYRDEHPLWSADGRYILFERIDARGRASAWLVPSSGGSPIAVVEELTPSPDPFNLYGHVDWESLIDWWRGPPP